MDPPDTVCLSYSHFFQGQDKHYHALTMFWPWLKNPKLPHPLDFNYLLL